MLIMISDENKCSMFSSATHTKFITNALLNDKN